MECHTDLGLICFETLSYHLNCTRDTAINSNCDKGFLQDPQLISSRNVFSTKSFETNSDNFLPQIRGSAHINQSKN